MHVSFSLNLSRTLRFVGVVAATTENNGYILHLKIVCARIKCTVEERQFAVVPI